MYVVVASPASGLQCLNQLARDVGGVNVGGVKGMCFDRKCMSCTKCLHYVWFYVV